MTGGMSLPGTATAAALGAAAAAAAPSAAALAAALAAAADSGAQLLSTSHTRRAWSSPTCEHECLGRVPTVPDMMYDVET